MLEKPLAVEADVDVGLVQQALTNLVVNCLWRFATRDEAPRCRPATRGVRVAPARGSGSEPRARILHEAPTQRPSTRSKVFGRRRMIMKASVALQGEIPTLEIEGELDVLSVPALRPLVEELIFEAGSKVVVDVSKLRLIDSSGVGALIALFRRLTSKGSRMTLRGAQEQPLFILRLMKLDRILMADDGPKVMFARRSVA